MANPFLVLGGIAVGIVVAAMGVLQVPGWVKSAQDASAINDLSNAAIGEAVSSSRLGEYLNGPELISKADELGMSFELSSGVKVCVTRNDDRTAYAAVAISPSGAYFARIHGSTEAIEGATADEALAAVGNLPAGVPNPVIGGDCAPESALPTLDDGAGGPGGETPDLGSDPDNQPFAAMFTLNCDVQTEVSLPIRGNVAGTATWSDGYESRVADGGVEPRVLEAGVTYQVMFDGTFIALTGGGGLDCFRSMDSWSDESGTQVADGAFAGMTNLTSVPANLPPTVFLINHAFAGATSFNDADVARWDVSSVTHAINVFDGATAFQQDINGWTFSSGREERIGDSFGLGRECERLG